MARVAPKSPIDPKMFRHFVVVTIMATGLLAMFASGERREAFEQQLAEKRELKQAELELARQGKGGNTSLVFKDNRRSKTSWGSDYGTTETTEVPLDSDEAPELIAASDPQFIDLSNTAHTLPEQPTVAPPGMTAQGISELQKRKKKRAVAADMLRRPPPIEGDEAAE